MRVLPGDNLGTTHLVSGGAVKAPALRVSTLSIQEPSTSPPYFDGVQLSSRTQHVAGFSPHGITKFGASSPVAR